MTRIIYRRIKTGQVVGFQTVNTLFENDRALDAALEGLNANQDGQEVSIGELADRLDAAEVVASSAATAASSAQTTANAASSSAAAAQATANQAKATAGTALGLAQDHVPTLADHEARIFALESEEGGGGGGAGGAAIELPCSAALAVGDCAMMRDGQAVRADPLSLFLTPAIGVVVSKPSGTRAIVQTALVLRGVYSGLLPGRLYFVGADGRPASDPPLAEIAGGAVGQQVIGFALLDGALAVRPATTMFIDQE